MTILIQILQFVFIISVLVVLHELGHFLPAKFFKTKVEKFYLFFDPWFSLAKKKVGETVYGIGWLPLGGYVKIAGMIDESMDTEQMKQPPKPWEFRSKPAWQRLIIMLGGIIVNILLAWFIYGMLLATKGDTYIPMENLKNGIAVNEKGKKLGFKNGDKIISIDGKKVEKFEDLFLEVLLADNVLIDRNGQQQTIEITDEGLAEVFTGLKNSFFYVKQDIIVPETHDSVLYAKLAGLKKGDRILGVNGKYIESWEQLLIELSNNRNKYPNFIIEQDGEKYFQRIRTDSLGRIGIKLPTNEINKFYRTDTYSAFEAIPAGLKKTYKTLINQIRQFKVIFKPKTKAYTQVKGPIGIASLMPPTWNWNFVWSFMAMFSVWLAFVNILPIPALDGGHAMFLLYEMITGKEPSQKVLERGQVIGFLFIAGLMLLIIGNDIWNIIKNFLT